MEISLGVLVALTLGVFSPAYGQESNSTKVSEFIGNIEPGLLRDQQVIKDWEKLYPRQVHTYDGVDFSGIHIAAIGIFPSESWWVSGNSGLDGDVRRIAMNTHADGTYECFSYHSRINKMTGEKTVVKNWVRDLHGIYYPEISPDGTPGIKFERVHNSHAFDESVLDMRAGGAACLPDVSRIEWIRDVSDRTSIKDPNFRAGGLVGCYSLTLGEYDTLSTTRRSTYPLCLIHYLGKVHLEEKPSIPSEVQRSKDTQKEKEELERRRSLNSPDALDAMKRALEAADGF